MSNIKASLIQMDVAVLNSQLNLQRMCEFVRSEAKEGADLIIFPELSNTGYVEPLTPGGQIDPSLGNFEEYLHRLHAESASVDGELVAEITTIARQYEIYVVAGLSIRGQDLPGSLFNTCTLIGPQGLIHIYRKVHLWHCEKFYFTPGGTIAVQGTPIAQIGMQVCNDIRFPEVTRSLTLQGAELICSVWASSRRTSDSISDPDLFRHRAYTRAVENGVFFLSCNRSGTQGDHTFLGRSLIVAPNGKTLAASTNEGEEVVRGQIDLTLIPIYRASVGLLSDRNPRAYYQDC